MPSTSSTTYQPATTLYPTSATMYRDNQPPVSPVSSSSESSYVSTASSAMVGGVNNLRVSSGDEQQPLDRVHHYAEGGSGSGSPGKRHQPVDVQRKEKKAKRRFNSSNSSARSMTKAGFDRGVKYKWQPQLTLPVEHAHRLSTAAQPARSRSHNTRLAHSLVQPNIPVFSIITC